MVTGAQCPCQDLVKGMGMASERGPPWAAAAAVVTGRRAAGDRLHSCPVASPSQPQLGVHVIEKEKQH